MKTGRNYLCPCGSGKNFESCHGSSETSLIPGRGKAASVEHPQTPRPPSAAPPTLPGSVFRQVYQLIYKDHALPAARRYLRDRYRVVLTLAREETPPYVCHDEANLYAFSPGVNREGDSFIRVVEKGRTVGDESNSGRCTFMAEAVLGGQMREVEISGTSNKKGRLEKLSAEVEADDFYEAEVAVFDAAAPFLSLLSFLMDIPVRVAQIDVEQLSTEAVWWTSIQPHYDHILFGTDPIRVDPSFTPYLGGLVALYREGINSSSRNYQFLCLYKVIEAINWQRSRDDVARTRLKLPETQPKTTEDLLKTLRMVFPSCKEADPPWGGIFPYEQAGWRFSRIRQEKLEPIRNKIAHMLTDPSDGPGLLPDDTRHLATVSEWLPVLRLMARVMVVNEFDAYGYPDFG